MSINLDRGVTKRNTGGGIAVYMYKDEPGVFRSAFGNVISDDLAREAGFPVDALAQERRKRSQMAQAVKEIEAQYNEASRSAPKVIMEREGWQLVSIGMGMHNVLTPDGSAVNPTPMAAEAAGRLLNALVPVDTAEPEPEPAKEPEKETVDAVPTSDKDKMAGAVLAKAADPAAKPVVKEAK